MTLLRPIRQAQGFAGQGPRQDVQRFCHELHQQGPDCFCAFSCLFVANPDWIEFLR